MAAMTGCAGGPLSGRQWHKRALVAQPASDAGGPAQPHRCSATQQRSAASRVVAARAKGAKHKHPAREEGAGHAPPAAAPREVVVGIDLGTTNSAIAWMEGRNKPRCIPNRDGERVTPSVVSFLPGGDVVVGKAARKLQAAQPHSTYYSVKRLIGRPAADPVVKEEAQRVAFKVHKVAARASAVNAAWC